MKKMFLALVGAGLLFVGCQNGATSGKFEGTLPCASCPGIEVKLELNGDNTYTLTEEYVGENLKESSQGKYSVSNGILTLEGSTGISKVKVEGDKAFVLTPDGQIVEGDLAQAYILTKK